MTSSAKKLLKQVLDLPAEDQQWISDHLSQAQVESPPGFTHEELAAFDQRAAELMSGAVEGIPIESVLSELRERIRAHETGHTSSEGRRPD